MCAVIACFCKDPDVLELINMARFARGETELGADVYLDLDGDIAQDLAKDAHHICVCIKYCSLSVY